MPCPSLIFRKYSCSKLICVFTSQGGGFGSLYLVRIRFFEENPPELDPNFFEGDRCTVYSWTPNKVQILISFFPHRSGYCQTQPHIFSSYFLFRSDPELDTMSYTVGTLDRRVAMKSTRPRSLDLSTWSVESRGLYFVIFIINKTTN